MSDRGSRLYDANAPPRHGGGEGTRPGGTNPFAEMVKEMNLHLKCHARFEGKMKSQRQPGDFSIIKATGGGVAEDRRHSPPPPISQRRQTRFKVEPTAELKQSTNIKVNPRGGER